MAEKIFWVPKEAHWTYINENSKKPEIVQLISNGVKKHNKAAIMVTHVNVCLNTVTAYSK